MCMDDSRSLLALFDHAGPKLTLVGLGPQLFALATLQEVVGRQSAVHTHCVCGQSDPYNSVGRCTPFRAEAPTLGAVSKHSASTSSAAVTVATRAAAMSLLRGSKASSTSLRLREAASAELAAGELSDGWRDSELCSAIMQSGQFIPSAQSRE